MAFPPHNHRCCRKWGHVLCTLCVCVTTFCILNARPFLFLFTFYSAMHLPFVYATYVAERYTIPNTNAIFHHSDDAPGILQMHLHAKRVQSLDCFAYQLLKRVGPFCSSNLANYFSGVFEQYLFLFCLLRNSR